MKRFICFLSFCILAACTSEPALEAGQVLTSQGIAQGVTQNGLTGFIGIEYARAGRWEKPGAAPAWEGVKTFDTPAGVCPQKGAGEASEDCLFLNIFIPENTNPGADLPVLFQIHGGGLIAGQGGSGPAALAQQGFVVITMNYRLGRLGFYDYADWGADDPRNFGLLDVIAALDWTQDNVDNFGGDTDNITIAGHSAGGMMVQLLMVSPDARGKFSKAIARAGYGAFPFPKAANYTADQLATMRLQSLESLKAVSAAELILQTPHYILPFTGAPELPAQPVDMFRRGDQARVPYISGGNSFDGGGVLYGAGYTDRKFLSLFDDLPAVKVLYADDFAASDTQAAQRIFGDLRYVLSARETARAMEQHVVGGYTYYVDAKVEEQPGTPHGAETNLLWGQRPNPLQSYWLNFIRTGDPNSADLPRWEPNAKDNDAWMVFTPRPEPKIGVLADKLDYLKSNPIMQP